MRAIFFLLLSTGLGDSGAEICISASARRMAPGLKLKIWGKPSTQVATTFVRWFLLMGGIFSSPVKETFTGSAWKQFWN
jgi:hypothetical protein